VDGYTVRIPAKWSDNATQRYVDGTEPACHTTESPTHPPGIVNSSRRASLPAAAACERCNHNEISQ
jgi:hypothetical protein